MPKEWIYTYSERNTFQSKDWTAIVAWIIPILLMTFICFEGTASGQAQNSFYGQRQHKQNGVKQTGFLNQNLNRPSSQRTSFLEKPKTEVKPAVDPAKGKLFRPARVLAIVAGQPIFEGDLLLQINEVVQTRAADAPDFIKKQMIEKGIRELLPRHLEQKMLYHQAVSSLPDPTKISSIKESLYKQMESEKLPQLLERYQVQNLPQLEARLRSLGSSWRAMKEQVAEQEIAKFGISSKLNIDKEVGHSQLWKKYVENIKDYKIESQVRFEHLMVSFAKTPDRSEAWNRIAKMGDEVVYGAKFSDVAKKNSDGFFASKGGQYGWTKDGDLTNKALLKKAFSSPVGKLGDIFESQQGYHIIRVLEKQKAGYVPFEEVQDKIREKIIVERQQAALKKVMKEIKTKVPYKILIDGVKF